MKTVFCWFTILDLCVFFCFVTWGFLLWIVLKLGMLESTTFLIESPILKSWHCVACSVDFAQLNEPISFTLFCTNVLKLLFLYSWLCCSSVVIYLGDIFLWEYVGKATEASLKSMYILFITSRLSTRLAPLSKETRFLWSVLTHCSLWGSYFLGACKLIA